MSSPDDASSRRAAWYGVGLLALLLYGGIVAPAERRLGAIATQTGELYDLAARDERLAADLGNLQAARDRVEAEIARFSRTGGGQAAAAALATLAGETKSGRVCLTSVKRSPDATDPAGASDDLTIALRGRYRDVLAAIADIPRQGALMEVRSVSLSRASGSAVAIFPPVEAEVRATVYHNATALLKESSHAADRP
ncbi:MAG TPA: hypothetical protein VMH02_12080 [Verrucomicrobiae bacterium]|nr:hypothetical protein [Verrucomicrobiae bacterium]